MSGQLKVAGSPFAELQGMPLQNFLEAAPVPIARPHLCYEFVFGESLLASLRCCLPTA